MGHEEASANVNEKKLVEPLLDRLLGEDIEVELAAGDSQFESQHVFDAFEVRKMGSIIPWRRLEGRENPSDVLSVKDGVTCEGPEYLRVVYKRLRAMSESLNGRVKSRLAFGRFTWQGLEKRSHSSVWFLVCCVVYACRLGVCPSEQTGAAIQHRLLCLELGRLFGQENSVSHSFQVWRGLLRCKLFNVYS